MARRTFHDKLKNVEDWIEIFNYHWERLKGHYHNDKEFWDDTLHSMENQDWWDIVEIYPTLHDLYPGHFHDYGYIKNDIDQIERRLMLGKSVIAKNRQSHNFPAYHAMVVLKDVINAKNGTPTKSYKKNSRDDNDQTTPFENLFDIQ
jgi:hypothetical protein